MRVMKYGSAIYHMCKVMRDTKEPINNNQLFNALDEIGVELASKKSIDVMLCDRKHLFNKVREDCPCCGHIVSYYTLTDTGRMQLAEVERGRVDPSIEEFQELGVMVQHKEDLR